MQRLAPLLCVLFLSAPAAEAKVTRYLTGNPDDAMASATLHGPVLDLGGGGTDVDAGFQAMIDGVRGCAGNGCDSKLDIVILRASGADGYNDYLYAMDGVDSVETFVVTRARDLEDGTVAAAVRDAEVVFFAGGDQCDYVTLFKGTPIESAVESVYARGGAVGGTSAGMAIMGSIVFDACGQTATSDRILANPYHKSASFTYELFAWNDMGSTLTDQHFVSRDRMGRLLGFLARQVKDGKAPSALGVAADEETSIVVNRDGLATVLGSGNAYFVLADHYPASTDTTERVEPRVPLSYSGYRVWRVQPGQTFDLRDRPTSGDYLIDVVDGVISPANPY